MYVSVVVIIMTDPIIPKKGVPRYDGTGQGVRLNINRGGCNSPLPTGKGKPGRNRVVY